MPIEIEISPEVVSAAISLLGVLASALISKKTAERTARITANAEIQKLKIQHDYAQIDKAKDNYAKMVTAVMDYSEKHDIDHKAAAESSITVLIGESSGKQQRLLNRLLTLVAQSEPFDGPPADTLREILAQIAIIECGKK